MEPAYRICINNLRYVILTQLLVITSLTLTYLSPGERILPYPFSGADDESLDVSSHLGWKNATACNHETKTLMDRWDDARSKLVARGHSSRLYTHRINNHVLFCYHCLNVTAEKGTFKLAWNMKWWMHPVYISTYCDDI